MTLASLLSPDQIILEMESAERWSALIELVNGLVTAGKIKAEDKEEILADLRKREESMSTGIGFGVAIPHTSSDKVDQVVAAFGRSKDGIEFEALDNGPVNFVVLFVVPKNEFQMHLRTLAAIAKFLNDRGVREGLAAATTSEEMLKIFAKPSSNL